MESEAIQFGLPPIRNIFPGITDPYIPTLQFAATQPGGTAERRDAIPERRKLILESLVRGIIEINNTYYPQYTAAGITEDEAKEKENEEALEIANLVDPHVIVSVGDTEKPSLNAQHIATMAYHINRRANLEFELTDDAAEEEKIKQRQKKDLRELLEGQLDVGQPIPVFVADQAQAPWYRRLRERMAISDRRALRRVVYTAGGLVVTAFVIAGGLQIADAVSHTHTTQSYGTSQCASFPVGTLITGTTLSVGPDTQHQTQLQAKSTARETLLLNQQATVCDSDQPMTATLFGDDTSGAAQQIAIDTNNGSKNYVYPR